MRKSTAIGATVATAVLGAVIARSALQAPAVRSVDEAVLREYAGVYQWSPDAFVYLQMWSEGTGKNQLVAFDESGELRTLYPTDRDSFFTSPGWATPTAIESRVEFQREGAGTITSLTWRRDTGPSRVARRVEIEHREDVRFSNGDIRLAGTLISPKTERKHPAIILVHASGAEDREHLLPLARFLIRHGAAVLGYDKRGVGASTGEWNTASFDDLAGDVVAAFEYLKTRSMKPQTVDQIVGIMKLQYHFARTGEGWDEYARAREKLAAQMGPPPDSFPGTPDHPYLQFVRRLYFYDPAPTLRQLQVPTLALFGKLDNNIMAEKNKAAWEAALNAGGNRDYTLRILPKGNHLQLEAKVGTNAEMASLQRFVPEYSTTIREWLAKRLRSFAASR